MGVPRFQRMADTSVLDLCAFPFGRTHYGIACYDNDPGLSRATL